MLFWSIVYYSLYYLMLIAKPKIACEAAFKVVPHNVLTRGDFITLIFISWDFTEYQKHVTLRLHKSHSYQNKWNSAFVRTLHLVGFGWILGLATTAATSGQAADICERSRIILMTPNHLLIAIAKWPDVRLQRSCFLRNKKICLFHPWMFFFVQ